MIAPVIKVVNKPIMKSDIQLEAEAKAITLQSTLDWRESGTLTQAIGAQIIV